MDSDSPISPVVSRNAECTQSRPVGSEVFAKKTGQTSNSFYFTTPTSSVVELSSVVKSDEFLGVERRM